MSDTEPEAAIDFPIAYHGWSGNQHRTAAGAYDITKEKDTDRLELFDLSPFSTRDQREGRHAQIGGTLGVSSHQFRFLSLVVTIKRSTFAALEDAKSAFARAFDVQECQLDSPATRGILPLTFTSPTSAPPTGYTSPIVERLYARPSVRSRVRFNRGEGKAVVASVELVCEDPRRYTDVAGGLVLNSGGWSGTAVNWNSVMGVMVHPVITVNTSGNGASNLTISDGVRALVLDLSAAGAGTFTIDTYAQSIYKGSTRRDDLRTSSPVIWPVVLAGGNTWTVTNLTNLTNVTLAYRPARA